MFLINSVYQSNCFNLSLETDDNTEGRFSIPVIEDVLANLGFNIDVSQKSDKLIQFKGESALTFAFSAIALWIDTNNHIKLGDWVDLKQSPRELGVRGFQGEDKDIEATLLAEPTSLLHADKPALLIWDA